MAYGLWLAYGAPEGGTRALRGSAVPLERGRGALMRRAGRGCASARRRPRRRPRARTHPPARPR
eukprot:326570-Prymnesium_polylepis.1